MSKTDDQSSMTSADISWPVDRVNHDQIVFENVADQYVKGEDVKVYFAILHDMNINPHEDQIGLIRIGSNNINECLAYASIHLGTSTSYGTAVFPSSSLTMTDDEFYQFCYINDKRKNLGSSIPFQLNCSSDDIDLLSSSALQTSLEKSSHRQDSLIALADHDNDDLVVIHTKRMLMEEKLRQENRQLLVMNRRLEQENDESKGKLDLLDAKSNECINKVKNDMQVLVASHKAAIDELSARQQLEAKLRIEHDASLALCQQYQSESLQFAERCRNLEGSHTQMASEAQRLRSQLSTTSQLVDEQSKQIVDLENNLVESSATANQHQAQLEQKLRDLRLATEKHQLSMQTQIDAYTNQSAQQENQIHALETANSLLKEELKSITIDNTFLLDMVQQDKLMCQELQQQIDDLHEQRRLEKEHTQNELQTLRNQYEQSKENQHDSLALINSVNEIKKRCLKHQKSEIEVKKQLATHKEFVVHLQRKVQDLTDRLFAGGDEYKSLYRKYIALERMHVKNTDSTSKPNPTTLSDETGLNEEALVSLLRNSYELQQQDQQQNLVEEEKTVTASQSSVAHQEISECPMCYWEFPAHLTLENKKEHIEAHFN